MVRLPSWTASAAVLLASVASVAGQLETDCNPMNETCPADPALGTAYTFNFNMTPPVGTFDSTTSAGRHTYDSENGLGLHIDAQGDSPKLVSEFYFFFGRTEVIMKAASGQGIVSSIVWWSDVLDEVDWEFLGGVPNEAQTNYFGKDSRLIGNGDKHPVESGIIDEFHNYTTTWTKEKMEFYIDDALVRTLLYEEADGGHLYPQTPMKLSLGMWAGGDPENPQGTIDWAGGPTDYEAGPYSMYVKSARVEDFSSGKEYVYGDNSGSWESINIVEGNSTASESIHREPEKSMSEKWDELPSGTKTGVYVGAAAVAAILFGLLGFYMIRQRRRGAREAKAAAERQEAERMEMNRFHKEGRNPDDLAFDGAAAGAFGKGPNVQYSATYADSPPGSSAGPPEKAWDPTSGGGMRSPTSPSVTSPLVSPGFPPAAAGHYRTDSFEPIRSPPPPSPGSPGPRNFSTPTGARSSPGPEGFARVGSPASGMGGPPSRSGTASPRMPPGGGPGAGGGYPGPYGGYR